MATKRILIVGGGYVGTYTALGLQKRLRRSEAEIILVSPESFMVYQPFLPEAASGNIEPRHVVVPLRRTLKRTRVVTGRVASVDPHARRATVVPSEGGSFEVSYDILIVGVGSVSRVLDVPGLADNAIGFKTVAEAIHLRNHVLERMDVAESTTDEQVRRKALSFLFVGGGYAGIEALAELEDLARDACRYFATLDRRQMRWVLVEASDRILPELSDRLASYALARLRDRGIEVHLRTRLESASKGEMRLSDGEDFPADTLVWTTGVRAHPALEDFGLPTDDAGRLVVDEYLRVTGDGSIWCAGDCAAVPDVTTGKLAPPTAQHALREARTIAANIASTLKGGKLRAFKYKNRGSLVSLGRYKGVAEIMGVRVKGFVAWWLHRTYHLAMIPTMNRKVRVLVDWTVALFFRRDIVQLGSLTRPRDALAAGAHKSEDAN